MTATELAIVPPTDTLSFSLTEEAVVVNDTVRIVVRVHAQKALDGTEAALQADIRQAVRSFVDAPDWMLPAMRRDTQPTGLETVTLTASVVVPDTENHALKDRAEKASRPGLTLSNRSRILTYLQTAIRSSDQAGILPRLRAWAETLHGDFRSRWPDAVPLSDFPAFAQVAHD